MAKTILVVDDSATVREMVSFVLNEAGYGVISAVHGRDALNKLNTTTVDMVITDIDMPIMDGIEFIREMRKKPECRLTPVIIISGKFHNINILENVNKWFLKPFTDKELLQVIKITEKQIT